MLKNKRILLMLIIAIALIFMPNMVSAKATQATETTKTSTGAEVKWEYELDSNNDIVTLLCANKADIKGTLSIPSTIDGHKVKKLGVVNYNHNGTYVWNGTFEECYGLQGVTLPNTVIEIGRSAFRNCTGLKSIIIPDTVVSIGNYAYGECSGVSTLTIGKGVTSIGESAFQKCTGLKQLIIPNSVTSIGESAFYGCTGVTSLTLSTNISTINYKTFAGCKGLTSVKLPNAITTIRGGYSWEGAFSDCSNLTKILIPDSVATIETNAFCNCKKLIIYGNDGQVSKQYAEDNKIKFDYIANWDKASSGTDITAPVVKSMYIKYSSLLSYWDKTTNTYRIPTGGKIQIIVEFSEEIKGTTAPTLKIKCGDGETRTISDGAISGAKVVYNYTIQSGDVGVITAVNYEGPNVTDNTGNKAELSCKSLYVEYSSGSYAYANGTKANVDDENKQENNEEQKDNQKEETPNKPKDDQKENNGENITTNTNQDDPTIKNDSKLPQTGITFMSVLGIIILAVAIISKVKYGKYSDIK